MEISSSFFLEYRSPCAYLIDFLCIICYIDHFTQRKYIKYQKKYSGVMDFYALKLRLTAKKSIGKYLFTDT